MTTQPMAARTAAPTTAGALSIAHGARPATDGATEVLARFEEWVRRSPTRPR